MASQQALKVLIERIEESYHLQGKDFYIGGFSIGGTCVNGEVTYMIGRIEKEIQGTPATAPGHYCGGFSLAIPSI